MSISFELAERTVVDLDVGLHDSSSEASGRLSAEGADWIRRASDGPEREALLLWVVWQLRTVHLEDAERQAHEGSDDLRLGDARADEDPVFVLRP